LFFDQSDYRQSYMDRKEQRQVKMRSLADSGFHSFYYVSHASFLFAVSNSQALREVRNIFDSRRDASKTSRIEDA
jgi:hypothetical protein